MTSAIKEDISHQDEKDVDAGERYEVQDTDAVLYVNPDLLISEEENKRLRNTIHKRILPLMCLCYITQSLDKGTLGSASIMGWLTDVNAQGQDYALTGTILWAGIMLGEPLTNQFVRRLPVAKFLGICMFIWSGLVMGLAFSLSIPLVFAIRFFLGFFESAFGPCLLTITVQWYTKTEQVYVQAIWQSMLGLAGTFSSLFSFGLYHLSGKHAGLVSWQWLHVMVALISFIASVIVITFLPDSPTKARWASEDDKTKYVERVRVNDQGIKQKQWKSDQAIEAFKDPMTYLLFLLPAFSTLVVGGLGTFNNLLINRAFGFTVAESQLLSIPLAAVTVALFYLMAFLISKTKQTLYCVIGFVMLNIIGNIILITVPPNNSSRGGLIVAFYMMQALGATNPAAFLMLSRNSAGQTKKSITYAVTYIGWAGGNAAAPQLFRAKWAPRYLPSLYIHFGLYACIIMVCLTMRVILVRRNNKKIAAQTNAEGVVVNTNSHAFDGLTDLANPDFRYSL